MKNCQQCQKQFEIEPQDQAFYQKIGMPEPVLCPDCQMQRKLAWRNDRNLFHNTCSKTGKKVISAFPPECKTPVIDKDIFWGDQHDGRDYGIAYDPDKPFFDQYEKVIDTTPLLHILTANSENSLYSNYAYFNKNCYLCFAGNHLEDSFYCYCTENSRDCGDCLFCYNSELCYECTHCINCYDLKYSLHCRSCKNSAFLEDCTNCQNCFMCWNLTNQNYCYQNQQYSKEEYEKIISQFNLQDPETIKNLQAEWQQKRQNQPHKETHNISTENCSGEYIHNSKNCHNSYIVAENCEDCRYILNAFPGLKDSYHCTYSGEDSELIYDSIACGANCHNIFFGHISVINSSDTYYCNICISCKNCFGCSGLRNAQYCILNKQYTKEEYEKLVPQIIENMKRDGEWGMFPPARLSRFSYHQTLAQEYYPLTKEEALAQGFNWQDDNKEIQQTNEGLTCPDCQKKFRITSAEEKFYQKLQIAPPQSCFNCRHQRRLKIRAPYSLTK